jgi:hypothetical protein
VFLRALDDPLDDRLRPVDPVVVLAATPDDRDQAPARNERRADIAEGGTGPAKNITPNRENA